MRVQCTEILNEAGIDFYPGMVIWEDAAQLAVTDDSLTKMMKFITDKYNSIDFSEIEKSAGDIDRFKYAGMLRENAELLKEIYQAHEKQDSSAAKYVEVCDACLSVDAHLRDRKAQYSALYQSGNGMIQILYTSLVAAEIYAIGTLVSNTIRFVTTEQGTSCEVMYNEIPGTIKHVHIKNILAASRDIDTFNRLLDGYSSNTTGKALKESISLGTLAGAVLGIGFIIILIPRVLSLIREIIYSVYFMRVRIAEMLRVEAELLNTNIESLEAGRGSKKVIVRQKKVAETLTKWQHIIEVKSDSVNSAVLQQKKSENARLKVEPNSPLVQEPGSDPGSLLI